MKSYAEIKKEREEKILSGKPLAEGRECHNCGWRLPGKGHFCAAICAQDYEIEKAEILARGGR